MIEIGSPENLSWETKQHNSFFFPLSSWFIINFEHPNAEMLVVYMY